MNGGDIAVATATSAVGAVTEGTLLGGRVRYAQARRGYRTALEPVLLAAFLAVRAGERVLEGGTGAGAGLLCLSARVGAIGGVGVERDPATAAIAARNIVANGALGLAVEVGDLLDRPGGAAFDHAFANPPWHAGSSALPDDMRRRGAMHGDADTVARWAMALACEVRPGGTVALAVPAARVSLAVAALREGGGGGIDLLPLWPTAGREAKCVLLRTRRGGRSADRLLTGLVLHSADGGFTEAAEAVLRDAAALP